MTAITWSTLHLTDRLLRSPPRTDSCSSLQGAAVDRPPLGRSPSTTTTSVERPVGRSREQRYDYRPLRRRYLVPRRVYLRANKRQDSLLLARPANSDRTPSCWPVQRTSDRTHSCWPVQRISNTVHDGTETISTASRSPRELSIPPLSCPRDTD